MITRNQLRLALAVLLVGAPARAGQQSVKSLQVHDVVKRTVYHSPQTPGYTAWVGCWRMPEGKLMVSFHQATGPIEGRPRTRADVLEILDWPPKGKPEYSKYDMAGLNLEAIHLSSADDGAMWSKTSSEPAATPMNGWTCEPEVATKDGTIFRATWGQYLPFYDVPQTGYMQVSHDGSRTWSPPAAFFDERIWKTFPRRMRLLSDGRLVVAGGVVRMQPGVRTRPDWEAHISPALWFSDDREGHWSGPLIVWNDPHIPPSEEIDFAELPDGDLLVVFRVDAAHCRYQTLLRKTGQTWRPEPVRKTWLPHSGQPELLSLPGGIVLHLATDGIAWTADKGEHWAYVEGNVRTGYYPRSVLLPDGRVFCVYHVGSDDYYGRVDQRIEAITFAISRQLQKDAAK